MITNPIKYTDLVQTLKTINDEEGAPGLFRGLTFSLFGTNSACPLFNVSDTIPVMATTYAGFYLAELIFGKPADKWTPAHSIFIGAIGTLLSGVSEAYSRITLFSCCTIRSRLPRK